MLSDSSGRRRKLFWAVAVLVTVILVAVAVAAGVLAWKNADTSRRWQGRAERLERQVVKLNDVLVERSTLLDGRTRQANLISSKLKTARRALELSESDVSSLEARQRDLANEKAQIEDARAALEVRQRDLEDVATAYVDCKRVVVDIANAAIDENWQWVNDNLEFVNSQCAYADDLLDQYLQRDG